MAGKSAYTIQIPKPCHEDWDRMNTVEKGRFCNSCKKNVVDFSKMTDQEIVKIIENSTGNLCGKFMPSQLNRDIYIEKYNNHFPLKANVLAGLLALAILQPIISNASTTSTAIETNVDLNQHHIHKSLYPREDHDSAKYKIKGRVVDPLYGEPIAFANIIVEGESRGTTTDVDGIFELEVQKKDRLKIACFGYETQMFFVDEKIITQQIPIIIEMKESIGLKGDVVIIKLPENRIGKDVIYKPTEAQTDFLLKGNR